MRKMVVLLSLFIAAGCSSPATVRDTAAYSPPTGSIVLRVEVTSVEFTDWSPNCFGKSANCVPVHFWYKYRARVKRVVLGSWTESQVAFTHLQHAEYIPEVTRDCYIVLTPSSPDISSKIGVSFVADRILSRFWKEDRAAIEALRDGA
jgi:hypothetical protein